MNSWGRLEWIRNWKFLYGCGAFLFYFLAFRLWQGVVTPSPDFQYPEFFSNFVNYLVVSKYIGNDFFYILGISFDSDYPLGFSLFPLAISFLGIQDVFIQDPWLLNLVFYLPLCAIPLLFDWERWRVILFYLIAWFFPVTQIMFKGFNPQTPIILMALLAICFYLRYLRSHQRSQLLGFLFFAWFAISIKHLGAFYLAVFFLTVFFWRILRREQPILEIKLAMILVVLSFPFYPLEGVQFYFSHVVRSHNPILGTLGFFIFSLMALAVVWGVLMLLRCIKGSGKLPSLLGAPTVLGVCFSLTALYLLADTDANHSVALSISTLCFGLLATAVLMTRYDLSSPRGLSYLLCVSLFTASTTLYLSMVGHTAYIGYLPLLLILVIMVNEVSLKTLGPWLTLMVCIGLSNFFPSRDQISRILGDEHFYFRFFYTVSQNPLGWQKNPLFKARQDFIKILELYHYDFELYQDGLPMDSIDLDLDVFGFLYDFKNHFPTPKTDLVEPEEFIRDHFSQIKNRDFSIFQKWLEEGKILVFLQESRSNSDLDQRLAEALSAFEKEVSTGSLNKNDILLLYSLYLETLQDFSIKYYSYEIDLGSRSYRILIHPKLKPRSIPVNGPNHYLTKHVLSRS